MSEICCKRHCRCGARRSRARQRRTREGELSPRHGQEDPDECEPSELLRIPGVIQFLQQHVRSTNPYTSRTVRCWTGTGSVAAAGRLGSCSRDGGWNDVGRSFRSRPSPGRPSLDRGTDDRMAAKLPSTLHSLGAIYRPVPRLSSLYLYSPTSQTGFGIGSKAQIAMIVSACIATTSGTMWVGSGTSSRLLPRTPHLASSCPEAVKSLT